MTGRGNEPNRKMENFMSLLVILHYLVLRALDDMSQP
jgi:hypothetical protein